MGSLAGKFDLRQRKIRIPDIEGTRADRLSLAGDSRVNKPREIRDRQVRRGRASGVNRRLLLGGNSRRIEGL